MREATGASVVRFSAFCLDPRRGLLLRQNEDGALTPVAIGLRALDVLGLLIDRHGDLVSKDEILTTVWPEVVVEGANVTVQISALRRVLREGRSAPRLIQTVPGRGYRFTAPVSLSDGVGTDSAASGAAGSPNSEASQFSTPSAQAERRLISVLSCGTTCPVGLNGDTDPEEALAIIAALHRTCVDVIGSYGGFVANSRGGNLLAYFGYPQAHEDDAERAVRAALGLVEAIGQLRAPNCLNAQIGIATGVVVVGELIGQGEAQERPIVGDAPQLAVKLQALAEPNAIVVADGSVSTCARWRIPVVVGYAAARF
jgi:DNA-binding winged helix-turn-helix (wHTH) protein